MTTFSFLFILSLLSKYSAQLNTVEINADGSHVSSELLKLNEALKYLELKGIIDDEHERSFFFNQMRKFISEPVFNPKSTVIDYAGIVGRILRFWEVKMKNINNSNEAGETEAEAIPEGEHVFSHAEFPGYNDVASSLLVMIDNPKTLVQRVQLSGLCYMHAPAVVQYYSIWNTKLQQDHNATSDHGMLDISLEVLHFNATELEDHLFHDKGKDSLNFLQRILHSGSIIEKVFAYKNYTVLSATLKQYGPALVSRFIVYQDFMNKTKHHHHEPPETGTTVEYGLHAMVLVGIRTDSNGDVYFLLQNWWSGKQFVEVSREYIIACQVSFYFVKTPQMSVPIGHRVHSPVMHSFELAEGIDLPESYLPEMICCDY